MLGEARFFLRDPISNDRVGSSPDSDSNGPSGGGPSTDDPRLKTLPVHPHQPEPTRRLRLGNIRYSNCFPVHARLLDRPQDGDPELIDGVPSTLNRLLADRQIDVAPSSSIEYALHADRYRLMPDLVIGSRGAVGSIVLLSRLAPEELEGHIVGIPTASASSVVLLKVLLRTRWRVNPTFSWFDQATEDPLAAGASAALFIGDIALRPGPHAHLPVRLDLGLEWWRETGLPFAFALWQVSTDEDEAGIRDLHRRLLESRGFGETWRHSLAERYAAHFQMSPPDLERYWNDLSYQLDESMLEGLSTFYRLAAEIGEIPRAPILRWIR
jgi:chorismate dehydratase